MVRELLHRNPFNLSLELTSLTKDETLHFYTHTSLRIRTCVHMCVGDDFSILFSYIISLFSCDSPFSAPFIC